MHLIPQALFELCWFQAHQIRDPNTADGKMTWRRTLDEIDHGELAARYHTQGRGTASLAIRSHLL